MTSTPGTAPPAQPPAGHLYRRLHAAATAVLDRNWAGDHTVPSRALYPHQWSWDTAFIAVGLAHHAPDRAWRELRSLFAAQWPDGRVPHIVFDPGVAERDYFPGPAFWRVPQWHPRPGRETTGIVQPPVHALAAWEVYRATGGDTAVEQLRWLYPRLVAQQRYLATARNAGRAGLASIVHPWESGTDNSPAWDQALATVPADLDLLRTYQRRDIQVAAAQHRPTDQDYARYIAIATAYRGGGYRDRDLLDRHPFLVECPGFNAITVAAEQALARIATVVGADPVPHRDRAARITQAMIDRLYDPATGMFHALDVRTGKLSPARCVAGLLPLLIAGLPAEQVSTLLAEMASPRFGLADRMGLPLPSYDRTATDFEPLRYWRGPIWINMNWLVWHGLREQRRPALAGALRHSVLDLIDRSGCYEYFQPHTGTGVGVAEFSWTAALALDLIAAAG